MLLCIIIAIRWAIVASFCNYGRSAEMVLISIKVDRFVARLLVTNRRYRGIEVRVTVPLPR